MTNKKSPLPAGFIKHPVHFLALGFGSGLVPKLPGTAGTVVAIVIYWPMQQLSLLVYCAIVAALFLLGIWLCDRTAKDLGVHDHASIVWDEIVGYLVTMILAPSGWFWIILGFILFRLFDIWKPWPIRVVDKKIQGGLGIMIDDVLAGILGLTMIQIMVLIRLM